MGYRKVSYMEQLVHVIKWKARRGKVARWLGQVRCEIWRRRIDRQIEKMFDKKAGSDKQ